MPFKSPVRTPAPPRSGRAGMRASSRRSRWRRERGARRERGWVWEQSRNVPWNQSLSRCGTPPYCGFELTTAGRRIGLVFWVQRHRYWTLERPELLRHVRNRLLRGWLGPARGSTNEPSRSFRINRRSRSPEDGTIADWHRAIASSFPPRVWREPREARGRRGSGSARYRRCGWSQ